MKLYYAPAVCSLASHIALVESGLPYSLAKVDIRKHTLEDGSDYYAINPKGYVPMLQLDDGTLLAEGVVILQYIADQVPGKLAPAYGTLERYRVMEWLTFVNSEVHKQYSPLFYPTTPDATKEAAACEAREPLRVPVEGPRVAAVSHGRIVHDCGRISLHHPQLVARPEGRPLAVSRARGVPGARSCASVGAARDDRRGSHQAGTSEGRRLMKRLPTLFLSHGSPMHAIEPGAAGRAWAALGRTLPRPRAALVASAHWETSVPMLTGNAQPSTIHDFGGFPPELYQLRYPAAGAPTLPRVAVALAQGGRHHRGHRRLPRPRPRHVGAVDAHVARARLSLSCRFHCSQAWARCITSRSVAHSRRLPVKACSSWVPATRRTTCATGLPTAAGRSRCAMRRTSPRGCSETLDANDTEALVDYRDRAPGAERSHPTDEHFLPLHVAWGAAGEHPRAESILSGFESGALALDSWIFH
jgi:hypothetical protein